MKLSDTSIRNPVFAWMLMLALMVFGAICFSRMGVSRLPDVDFPFVDVSLVLEGAAPEVMETTVVDLVENALITVEGIKSISSSSKQGRANVTVEFELERDINQAVNDVQNKLTSIQRLLPKDLDAPTITKTNPEDNPIVWVAASSTTNDRLRLTKYVRDVLKDKFAMISGVGDVFLGGYVEPNIRIWINPEALKKYNIGVNDVLNSLNTEHTELPGGQITNNDKVFSIRTMGEPKSLEELKKVVISSRAGQQRLDPFNLVRLGDVARVEEGLAEITRTSRFNGNLAMGVGIRKQKGTNSVEVAKKIRAKIDEIQPQLPSDLKVQLNFDSTEFISEAVHELNFTLLLSALLTALACWFFLGSWSATMNVVLAIPTSILGAFIPLYFLGFTLNTFTLLGLSLAIGIVVDDAIMVLENIVRHRQLGKGQIEAAILGAREIYFAALAATLAIIAIFLPVAFMKGLIGKFFFEFGITISFAVFISLIEALTLTPMRSAQFDLSLKRATRLGRAVDGLSEWLSAAYHKTLKPVVKHPWITLGVSVALLLSTFPLLSQLKKEFAPPQDTSTFMMRLTAPPGSSVEYTDGKVRQIEAKMTSYKELERYSVALGGFGSGAGDTNFAMMFVTLKKPDLRPRVSDLGRAYTQMEFMDVLRKDFSSVKGIKTVLFDLSMMGMSSGRGFPIEFTLRGDNWQSLAQSTEKVMKAMESSGMFTDVDTNYQLGAPELQITPNREKAALYGISIQSLGQAVNALVGGVRVGQFQQDGHRYDIRVQLDKSQNTLSEVDKILVANSRGNLIPISQVTTSQVEKTLQAITRIDRQRAISIFSNLSSKASQDEALLKIKEIASQSLSERETLHLSGSSQGFKEAGQSLVFALLLGLLIAYMVLAGQFNSFIDPFVVLLALPFSITGAALALKLTNQSLNMYSMIGVILLMGIVKKNSILLVEFTNHTRTTDRLSVVEALLKACPLRLRPILMTSFATIAGALPAAFALGPGAETRIPMAITIIGGVLVSTLLTLYVVPSAYLLLAKWDRRTEKQLATEKAFAAVDQPTYPSFREIKDWSEDSKTGSRSLEAPAP